VGIVLEQVQLSMQSRMLSDVVGGSRFHSDIARGCELAMRVSVHCLRAVWQLNFETHGVSQQFARAI
jgi:hypothetical protein